VWRSYICAGSSPPAAELEYSATRFDNSPKGGGIMRTKETAVCEAWQKRERLEAIVTNTIEKYGRVSERLAQQLLFAQIDYAVAKDDLNDPYMRDE
jgi:hypothetical protein